MRILVFSDSHSSLRFMRTCTAAIMPDSIIHLGDLFADGQTIAEEFPNIPLYQVPGNCDMYRCSQDEPEIRIVRIGGADFYLTHGHRHHVKSCTSLLLKDARANHVDAVLYGHTHMEDCHQETDGLWVMNPGTCGYGGGTAGLIEVSDGKIQCCRILRHDFLEG